MIKELAIKQTEIREKNLNKKLDDHDQFNERLAKNNPRLTQQQQQEILADATQKLIEKTTETAQNIKGRGFGGSDFFEETLGKIKKNTIELEKN